jgi:hypothetical protein
MCLKPQKEIKKSETRELVPFVIRDIVPDDLIVTENKVGSSASESKMEGKIGLTDFLNNHGDEDIAQSQGLQNIVGPAKQGKRSYFTKVPAEQARGVSPGMNEAGRRLPAVQQLIPVDPEVIVSGNENPNTVGHWTSKNGRVVAESTAEGSEMQVLAEEEDVAEMEVGSALKGLAASYVDLG